MKIGAIVLDSNNADTLADFYAKLLGWKKERYDAEWVHITNETGEGPHIVFQQVEEYQRPEWPGKPGFQQQMLHVDFYTENVPEAVEHALACGAVLSDTQLDSGWRVLLDPAGHPFCILPTTPPDEELKAAIASFSNAPGAN